MDELHKKTIIKNYEDLVKDLDFKDIRDYLIQEEILNEEHCEEIEARKTRADRVREFLRILQTRGPRAYDSFINALNKSNKEYIASDLEKFRETLGVPSPTAQNTAPPSYAGVKQEPNQPVTSSGRQVAQATDESMTGVKQTMQPQDVEMKNGGYLMYIEPCVVLVHTSNQGSRGWFSLLVLRCKRSLTFEGHVSDKYGREKNLLRTAMLCSTCARLGSKLEPRFKEIFHL